MNGGTGVILVAVALVVSLACGGFAPQYTQRKPSRR